jgi:4'-phosphopantetheinyl transferase
MYNIADDSMDSRGQDVQISVTELRQRRLLEPPAPELAASSIHIWQFPLAISDDSLEGFNALLSEDEGARAARFHFEKDTRRFTVARAAVRSILGSYTRRRAGDLRFDYAHYGKPALSNVDADLRFSVSHSGEFGMLAVALGREVGVDLEAIRLDVETDTLAQRFFSELERTAIRGLPLHERVRAFFRCWTCKEAFLKGQGLGLSRSLESFDVEVRPDYRARLLATRPDPEEAARWSLHDIPVEENYAAAVAWEGAIAEIKILRHT